ncbi:chondroitin proteoglycan 2 [Spodoptera frugiperda]|uniref:Chondroitin proteoglycan 2 n=1 Tax=Spodoptera frugiperda TaxID=7108 RepID=A0A9R0ENS7_SPOFR|nr:chondroitin proteoglycan 2 [Spodoptera frugiperda]
MLYKEVSHNCERKGFNMKDIIPLLLVCSTTVVLANVGGIYNNGCPKDTSINKLLPHENCNQYYQCFHGALITRYCPSGLHFNIKRERCDWRGNLKCKSKKTRNDESKLPDSSEELDSSNPNHAGLICSSPDSNGVLVAHENCNEFYKCSYGKPVGLKCAPDLLYNPSNEKCELFQNVDCNDRIVPIKEKYVTSRTKPKITTSATEICANSPDGVLIVHTFCNKFYKCTGGKAIAMSCPSHLMYNTVIQHCDWPRNVDCTDRMLNENDDSNSKSEEIDDNEIPASDEENAVGVCANDNSEGVVVSHEKCSHYYKCKRHTPVDFNCPDRLYFNANKKICDWPENVDCGERITYENDNDGEGYTPRAEFGQHQSEPVSVRAVCSAEGSDDTLIAHEYCNQFYKCRDGQPITLTCPGNLYYNPSKEFCDWSSFVDCGDRIVPYSQNDHMGFANSPVDNALKNNDPSDPTDAPAICAAENSDGILVAHENCNQFYKCYEGKPTALFCQLNLFYNPKKGFCDWQHNVNCGNRAIPGENSLSDDENNFSELCAGFNEGKILPHENCSQFYKCMNGQLFPMDCPPGLYFNSMLKVCDWPMNVDCGERLTESQARNTHGIIRRAHGVVVLS